MYPWKISPDELDNIAFFDLDAASWYHTLVKAYKKEIKKLHIIEHPDVREVVLSLSPDLFTYEERLAFAKTLHDFIHQNKKNVSLVLDEESLNANEIDRWKVLFDEYDEYDEYGDDEEDDDDQLEIVTNKESSSSNVNPDSDKVSSLKVLANQAHAPVFNKKITDKFKEQLAELSDKVSKDVYDLFLDELINNAEIFSAKMIDLINSNLPKKGQSYFNIPLLDLTENDDVNDTLIAIYQAFVTENFSQFSQSRSDNESEMGGEEDENNIEAVISVGKSDIGALCFNAFSYALYDKLREIKKTQPNATFFLSSKLSIQDKLDWTNIFKEYNAAHQNHLLHWRLEGQPLTLKERTVQVQVQSLFKVILSAADDELKSLASSMPEELFINLCVAIKKDFEQHSVKAIKDAATTILVVDPNNSSFSQSVNELMHGPRNTFFSNATKDLEQQQKEIKTYFDNANNDSANQNSSMNDKKRQLSSTSIFSKLAKTGGLSLSQEKAKQSNNLPDNDQSELEQEENEINPDSKLI